jgi:hypothetical protein
MSACLKGIAAYSRSQIWDSAVMMMACSRQLGATPPSPHTHQIEDWSAPARTYAPEA